MLPVLSNYLSYRSFHSTISIASRSRTQVPTHVAHHREEFSSWRSENGDSINFKDLPNEKTVRTRYAPSPTGKLHLGGLRTALFSYLLAKKHGGSFLLRIEDTDKTREVPGAVELLEKDLKWATLDNDEGPSKGGPYGPYIQSQRLDIYKHHVHHLLEKGSAYRCFCSEERLESVRELAKKKGTHSLYDRYCLSLSKHEVEQKLKDKVPHTVRFKVPAGVTEFHDLLRGKVKVNNMQIDDQILLKSDDFPTYHLASVVDDHLMKISHVIRGEEWLPSLPKHIMLYQAFGWEPPDYAHLPLLMNDNDKREKLSKRQGDISVQYYRENGYLADALLNFVVLLGWSPEGTKEVFSLDELVKEFSLERVNKAPSVCSAKKLKWFNEQYLRKEIESDIQGVVAEVKPLILNKLEAEGHTRVPQSLLTEEYLTTVVQTVKERINFKHDIADLCTYFFVDPVVNQVTTKSFPGLWKKDSRGLMEKVLVIIENVPEEDFTHEKIYNRLKETSEHQNVGIGTIFNPLRFLLTGTNIGAGVPHTMEVLGKQTCIRRLNAGLANIAES